MAPITVSLAIHPDVYQRVVGEKECKQNDSKDGRLEIYLRAIAMYIQTKLGVCVCVCVCVGEGKGTKEEIVQRAT